MRQVMVRYKVKPDQADHNAELVRAVYDELAASAPEGLRYATFRLGDGVSFVHVARVEGEHNPLQQLQSFMAFQAGIADRCDEPPVTSDLVEVGSYRFSD
jgi:hypothetical protein